MMKDVTATTMRMTIRSIVKQEGLKLPDVKGLESIKPSFKYSFQYINDKRNSLYIKRIDKIGNTKIYIFDNFENGYELVEVEIDENLVKFICG